MPDSRNRLRRTTLLYWMLLLYIIAALIWWFISLTRQNEQMKEIELSYVLLKKNDPEQWIHYDQQVNKINRDHIRDKAKFIGEGGIFLLLILVGAVYVYKSVRKQFTVQQLQQNFMMAVTHELKTPISVARLNLETMQKYELEPEKNQKFIRMTLDEIARLNFLTTNILVTAQLEDRGFKTTREELDFSSLCRDCILEFRNRFPDREFISQIEPDTDLKGDPLLLQMLINNLLENAIKYTAREGKIETVLKKKGTGVELKVVDEGAGIPDEEKKKIFSKFYRIGNESTRKTRGTGLGLYICRKIARAHNGDIIVTNHEPHGSIFTVTFSL